MTKNRIILIIAVLSLVIILPISIPVSVSSKGKLLPHYTWTLSKGANGRLLTSLNDNSTGINQEFTVTQFERGDAVQFKLNLDVIKRNEINKGDTIGYVISSEIEKDIEKLKGELETARASLSVQTSSEKESIIQAEKNKLEFAETELDEQTKVYTRKKKLFDRDLISQQEFEADEARYELAKININIAKERLRTVESGAKEEEINFASAQINAIENQILVLQKRFESNNIVAPINGLINRLFASDTLLVVNDTSKNVCLVPVEWSKINKIKIGQVVSISSIDVDEEIEGEVTFIDNSVNTINGSQYVLVTVLSNERIFQLKPGLIVECQFDCGTDTILNLFLEFIKPIIR
jgi:multidrug efflux pump subunit AcrA (membrane-fusion protein)